MAGIFDRRAWETTAWLDDDGYVLVKVETLDPSTERPEELWLLAAKRKLSSALRSWGMEGRKAERRSTRSAFEQWDEDEDWATGYPAARVYRTKEPIPELLEDPDEQAGRELDAALARG